MSAGRHNFVCEQYATFMRAVTWKNPDNTPVNLTGFTARMKVVRPSGTVLIDMLSTGGSPNLVLGGTAGTIAITIPENTTSTYTTAEDCSYDLVLQSAGGVNTRLLEGVFAVRTGVSEI